VLYGDREPEVDEREAAGWREATEGSCELHVFPGDHFYLEVWRRQVLDHVVRQARQAAAGQLTGWSAMP
jgi:pyochelin biosynthetic protein PchC